MSRTPEPKYPPPRPQAILAAQTCLGDVLTTTHLSADELVDMLIKQLPQDLVLLAARHPVLVYSCAYDESTRTGGFWHLGHRYRPVEIVGEFLLSVDLYVHKAMLH